MMMTQISLLGVTAARDQMADAIEGNGPTRYPRGELYQRDRCYVSGTILARTTHVTRHCVCQLDAIPGGFDRIFWLPN